MIYDKLKKIINIVVDDNLTKHAKYIKLLFIFYYACNVNIDVLLGSNSPGGSSSGIRVQYRQNRLTQQGYGIRSCIQPELFFFVV